MESPYTRNLITKIDKKLDTVIKNQHSMELKFTKRVDRNTFICSGVLWFTGLVIAAGVVFMFTLL